MTRVELETGGSVWKLLVKVGDTVEQGDTRFILEVMKMEVPYPAPLAGQIAAVHIAEGDAVEEDQLAEGSRQRQEVRDGFGRKQLATRVPVSHDVFPQLQDLEVGCEFHKGPEGGASPVRGVGLLVLDPLQRKQPRWLLTGAAAQDRSKLVRGVLRQNGQVLQVSEAA